MSGNTARLNAISEIANYGLLESRLDYVGVSTADLYGQNVFSLAVMKEVLPRAIFDSVKKTIQTGSPLDPAVADVVANAMKDWAISKGATHYAHVFYPLTGITAEKHDSFYVPDGVGGALAEFSGGQLIQGEPDASSFPSGGIRSTFEARGYTAWDVTSPAYILENPNGTTLCIPTAFVSWTGEALDKKTPLLRSMHALHKQAARVLKLFGTEVTDMITATAGPEQEYFLIDRNFYLARPDLISANRTLFGAPPAKGQEFADQYFGAIPERVLAFMHDSEAEMYKLGIPIKTRHNEVAPSQYETAPIYENGNVASDHQQLIMYTLKRVADKYGLVALLAEKPFAAINGSGKHLNWSLGSRQVGNLLEPGDTPHTNAQFLVFCSAVIHAVHKHSKILRAAIASAHNDHRLGAHEAPPAILSIFLGDLLTDVFEQVRQGGAKSSKRKSTLVVGVDTLPPLPKDTGDRNRTSPFAFTGNKFEFRAVGASSSIATPLMVLNTVVADSLDLIASRLEKEKDLNKGLQKVLQEVITEAWPIVFNGDNYSEEWHAEAERRGLPNLRTSPEAFPAYIDKEVLETFRKHKVLSKVELTSRYEIVIEQFILAVNTETKLVVDMVKTLILPAALRYLAEVADVTSAVEGLDNSLVGELTGLINSLQAEVKVLLEQMDHSEKKAIDQAHFLAQTVRPQMKKIRRIVDTLEGIVADDYWPLPSYQEMLFIK